ncbi:MAG: hypothetical protein ACK41G_09170 [Candidatus Thermochlorobacter sp.]
MLTEAQEIIAHRTSDLTRKVNTQNFYHDGNYSSIGSSVPLLRMMHEALQDDALVARSGLEEILPPHLRGGKWKMKKEA